MCRYGFSLLIRLFCVYPVLFSEIPGSVVWCLVLILKMFCPLLLQIISSIPYCLSSSGIPNTYILIFRMCQVLGVSVLFFFSFYALYLSLGGFYWPIFKLTEFSSNCVHTDESFKDILHLCYNAFYFWHLLLNFLRISTCLFTLIISSLIWTYFSIWSLSV